MAQEVSEALELTREFSCGLVRKMEAKRRLSCTCGRRSLLGNPEVVHEPPCPAYFWAVAKRYVELEFEELKERH
jgi:hypothetical protein